MKHIKQLVEAKQAEYGDDRKAYDAAGDSIVELIDGGKLRTSDISFRQLYEELVDVPLTEDAKTVAEAMDSSAFPTVAKKIIHKDIIDEYDLAVGAVGGLVVAYFKDGNTVFT